MSCLQLGRCTILFWFCQAKAFCIAIPLYKTKIRRVTRHDLYIYYNRLWSLASTFNRKPSYLALPRDDFIPCLFNINMDVRGSTKQTTWIAVFHKPKTVIYTLTHSRSESTDYSIKIEICRENLIYNNQYIRGNGEKTLGPLSL